MTTPCTVIADWKKHGSFIGTEYYLQIGAYALAPYLMDKATRQTLQKPPLDGAVVCWVGSKGCSVKLALDRAQVEEAGRQFEHALALYRFIRSRDERIANEEGRYANPLKPGEKLVSVTQVLKHVIAKPGLMDWSYDMGLSAGLQAGANQVCTKEELALALEARLLLESKTITRTEEAAQPWIALKTKLHEAGFSSTAKRDAAGEQGTTIHKNVMFYLQGKAVDLTNAPPWLSQTMSHFAIFAGKYQLEPRYVEAQVFDPDREFSGTLDFLGTAAGTLLNGHGGMA